MSRKSNTRRNGPCVTYKFKSEDHKKLYDAGKLSFEEATEVKKPENMLQFVTSYEITHIAQKHPNYVYPQFIHKDATRFMVVIKETGEVKYHRYLYTQQLRDFYGDKYLEVYVTNVVL